MIGAHLSAWCRVILTGLFPSIATLLLGFTDPSGFLFRFLIFSTLSAMFLKIVELGSLIQCGELEKFTTSAELFFLPAFISPLVPQNLGGVSSPTMMKSNASQNHIERE